MQYDPNKRKDVQEKEKMKPVISGGAKLKKKNGIEKAGGAFLEEDIRSVGTYVVKDVIIPATKKLLYDMFTNALGISLWGQNGAPRTGGYSGNNTNAARVSYNQYSNQSNNTYRASVSNGFDYDKIVFNTAGDAEVVLDAMRGSLEQGYIVTIADLYDLANVTTTNFQVKKYGWDDLRTAKVVRTIDGWSIILPKPTPID